MLCEITWFSWTYRYR